MRISPSARSIGLLKALGVPGSSPHCILLAEFAILEVAEQDNEGKEVDSTKPSNPNPGFSIRLYRQGLKGVVLGVNFHT